MIFIFNNSQIQRDEVEDDSEVMLIIDFNVYEINLSLTASQSLVKPLTSKSAERLPIIPLLGINKVVWKCCAAARNDIRSITINSVRNHYIFPRASFKYFSTVTIFKKD